MSCEDASPTRSLVAVKTWSGDEDGPCCEVGGGRRVYHCVEVRNFNNFPVHADVEGELGPRDPPGATFSTLVGQARDNGHRWEFGAHPVERRPIGWNPWRFGGRPKEFALLQPTGSGGRQDVYTKVKVRTQFREVQGFKLHIVFDT